MNKHCFIKLEESGRNIYILTEDYSVPRIEDTNIILGNNDIAICFIRETNTKYVYFQDKDTWIQYDFYDNEIEELTKSSFNRNKNSDSISNDFKGLLFEIYSAGYEAGMQNKDIVISYNDFYNDILRRISN